MNYNLIAAPFVELTYCHTLIYYDIPRVFISTDIWDKSYIVYQIDEDDTNREMIFLVVEITKSEVNHYIEIDESFYEECLNLFKTQPTYKVHVSYDLTEVQPTKLATLDEIIDFFN